MASAATSTATVRPGAGTRVSGLVCLVAGILGAASGVFLAVVPADGQDDTWRYPLSAGGFAAIQVWFAVQHVGLLAGIVALLGATAAGSAVVGSGRAGRLGVWSAAAGMAILTATELLAVQARDADLDEYGYLNALYGVSCILAGAGLVVAGLAVRRSGAWIGWRRWVVLVTGIWVLIPMFPAMLAGFLAARAGITGWMICFAALGWALWREEPGHLRRDVPTLDDAARRD